MRGILPRSIANFTELTVLQLGENILNSTIPAEICSLSKLTYLALDSNFFTGSIPVNIGGYFLSFLK